MTVEATPDDWAQVVLGFWFDELGPQGWFKKDASVDREIARRFLSRYEVIADTMMVDAVLDDADTALAAVIVLDQFARNMFRDTARAFGADPLALRIAGAAIERSFDQAVEKQRRLFFYLPFEHSEALVDQERSVRLISGLGNETLTRYAEAHKAIIVRFGRFPHRNEVLNRVSTPEERAFLSEPGSSF